MYVYIYISKCIPQCVVCTNKSNMQTFYVSDTCVEISGCPRGELDNYLQISAFTQVPVLWLWHPTACGWNQNKIVISQLQIPTSIFLMFVSIFINLGLSIVIADPHFVDGLLKMEHPIMKNGWLSHIIPKMDGLYWKIHLGMDQNLLIPFLVGWTSIYQQFWCSPGVQGFDPLPSINGWTSGGYPHDSESTPWQAWPGPPWAVKPWLWRREAVCRPATCLGQRMGYPLVI